MASTFLFSFVIAYFLLLLLVAWRTSRHSNNESFFIGNRNSNWMLVAFGMIGTSFPGFLLFSSRVRSGIFPGGGFRHSLIFKVSSDIGSVILLLPSFCYP